MRILITVLMLWVGSAYAANTNSYIQQYEDAVRKAIEEYMERLKEGDSQGSPGGILPHGPQQGSAPLPIMPSNVPPPANIYR